MATLNTTVQSVIDSMYTKMQAGTLTAEEQMLVGKGLEALMSNASWEKALIAIAEEHINESKDLLAQARTDLEASNTALTESMATIKSNYSQMITLGSVSKIQSLAASTSVVITPPEGARIRVHQLLAVGSNHVPVSFNYIQVNIGNRLIGTRTAGTGNGGSDLVKIGGDSFLTPSIVVTTGLNSHKELLGGVDEVLTLKNASGTAYVMLGIDFVTEDYNGQ